MMRSTSREPNATYLGRQPIFDNNQNVYGYELLFRSGNGASASAVDSGTATANVIYNTLMEIGLEDLVGDKLAFINFPRQSLINGTVDLLPHSRVVLEILEDVEIDEDLIAAVRSIVDKGYILALDDFVYDPKWEPLLELAQIVKLDVLGRSVDDIERVAKFLAKYDVRLLAEKVESHEEHETFREMGFDFYQGFFYSKPRVIQQDRLPDNQAAILKLVARLQDPEIEIEEVEKLVSGTVSLSYKLLRYINSASLGLRRQVASIREAVLYLGLRKLKDLASLAALSGLHDKSQELVSIGLIRGRTCELLGQRMKHSDHESFFLVGLFSILEALLDRPMEAIVSHLPLVEEISRALTAHEGVAGEVLLASIACETCDWSQIHFGDRDTVYAAYLDAIKWERQYSSL